MMDTETIRAHGTKLCASLRELGLYADDADLQVHELPDGRHVVTVDALIGDLAFSRRVQDPEQHDFDAEFRKMTRGSDADRFLDVRAQLEKRIADGKLLGGDR